MIACLNEIGNKTYNIINLTNYHGSHNISPNYSSWSMLIRELVKEFYEARKKLLPYAGRVSVCQLIGMDMFTYNFHQGNRYDQEQDILNRGGTSLERIHRRNE